MLRHLLNQISKRNNVTQWTVTLRVLLSLTFGILVVSRYKKISFATVLKQIAGDWKRALTAKETISREWFLYAASTLVVIKTSVDLVSVTSSIRSSPVSFWLTGMPDSRPMMMEYLPYILWSLPFIWLGTGLCVMRLRDAGLPRILVPLFFLPAINILFFIVCSFVPSQREVHDNAIESVSRAWLERTLPKSKLGIAAFAVLICSCLGVVGVLLGAYGLGNYGAPLFLGIPFFMGFLSALLYGVRERRTMRQCINIAMCSIFITALALVFFLIEGIVCIGVLFPIAAFCSIVGAVVGCGVQALPPGRRGGLQSSFACGLALLIGITLPVDPSPRLTSTTTIIVNRSPQQVWPHVVAFSEIAPPKEWLFLQGVAYPMRARIDGSGVGAIRYCEFSTGPFVEPITVWNEPHELRFTVTETPPALTEWNPLGIVISPHLKGYFASQGGQFLLTEVAPDVTEIRATTWYTHTVSPVWYWSRISDPILHLIHYRVLEHIKMRAEGVAEGS